MNFNVIISHLPHSPLMQPVESFLRCQFLCHVLKALFFITKALKLSYFCKKIQIFRALGAPPPDPQIAPPLRISGYAPDDQQFCKSRELM